MSEPDYKFCGDVLFGSWRWQGKHIRCSYIEDHREEFDWLPHPCGVLMPHKDGTALTYCESMGEA